MSESIEDSLDPYPEPPSLQAAGGTPPVPLSAMDRVQTHAPEADRETMSWTWFAGLVFLILGIVAVWFWVHRDASDPDLDLYRMAVTASRDFRPTEITDDPDQAASFILERFGLPIFPPELDGFGLLGVGPADLAPGVTVPAFRYDGANNATVVVFAYDYILLDEAAAEGLLLLAPEAYARLAEPEPVDSRRVEDAYVVSWRRRATIFSAVVPDEASTEQVLQSVRRAEI